MVTDGYQMSQRLGRNGSLKDVDSPFLSSPLAPGSRASSRSSLTSRSLYTAGKLMPNSNFFKRAYLSSGLRERSARSRSLLSQSRSRRSRSSLRGEQSPRPRRGEVERRRGERRLPPPRSLPLSLPPSRRAARSSPVSNRQEAEGGVRAH